MAYTIPVAALIIDPVAAEQALNLPSGFFNDPMNDRYEEVEKLAKLVNAPVQIFTDENEEIYDFGIHLMSDFYMSLDSAFHQNVASVRAQYPHPLVQNADLAIVSQFC